MTGSSRSLDQFQDPVSSPAKPVKSRKKKVPSYLHHKPSGRARVRIDGVDHYLGVYGSEESRIRYGQLIATPDGAPIDPLRRSAVEPGILISELMLAYIRHCESYYVKNGEVTAELSCIKSAIRPLVKLYGMTPANQFGALALKAVRQAIIDGKTMCRNFINTGMGRIRRAFRWGVENELCDATIIAKLESVAPLAAGRCEAIDHQPRHVVPQEEIDKVRAIVSQRTRDLIDLQLLCGARPGELVSLTGELIDQVSQQDKGVWVATLADHKMSHKGRQRALVFGPKSQLILRRYMHADDPTRKLFEITRAGYSLAIKKACTKLKIKRWTGHWLRHNFASQCRKDTDLDTTQQMLGHSDAATTQIYAHLDLTEQVKYARDAG